jgi:phosphate transport system protein
MPGTHIVKSYDDELQYLNRALVEMGGATEAQIEAAVAAVVRRDAESAQAIIANDDKIDALYYEIDALAMRLLALRQPMAVDLRAILAALRISGDLERIGDYAANIAKRAIPLASAAPMRPMHTVPRMSRIASRMLKDVLDAYVERDVDKAVRVWAADEEVDEMYVSLFRELLVYMMEDPRHITPCTHLLFIAKNLERIGDHITNVAETIHYLVTGTRMRTGRPKGGPGYGADLAGRGPAPGAS